MASSILLSSYVRKPEFEDFLNAFYDGVCESDMVKHYFFLAKKGVILQDMKKFSSYLTPKTSLDYRRPATATDQRNKPDYDQGIQGEKVSARRCPSAHP